VDFDIGALPPSSAIHRALLQLSADPAGSDFSSVVSDSIMAMFSDAQGLFARFEALSEVFTASGQKVYSINITPFVQYWVYGVGLPRVGLRIYHERNEVDGISVHGSATLDPALRPKLRIIYSKTRP
jgi:hypothetical protein